MLSNIKRVMVASAGMQAVAALKFTASRRGKDSSETKKASFSISQRFPDGGANVSVFEKSYLVENLSVTIGGQLLCKANGSNFRFAINPEDPEAEGKNEEFIAFLQSENLYEKVLIGRKIERFGWVLSFLWLVLFVIALCLTRFTSNNDDKWTDTTWGKMYHLCLYLAVVMSFFGSVFFHSFIGYWSKGGDNSTMWPWEQCLFCLQGFAMLSSGLAIADVCLYFSSLPIHQLIGVCIVISVYLHHCLFFYVVRHDEHCGYEFQNVTNKTIFHYAWTFFFAWFCVWVNGLVALWKGPGSLQNNAKVEGSKEGGSGQSEDDEAPGALAVILGGRGLIASKLLFN